MTSATPYLLPNPSISWMSADIFCGLLRVWKVSRILSLHYARPPSSNSTIRLTPRVTLTLRRAGTYCNGFRAETITALLLPYSLTGSRAIFIVYTGKEETKCHVH